MMRETTADGQTVVTETVKVTRKTYTQDWKAYNYAQTHEKSELQALLYELCKNLPEPEKRKGRGRPQLPLSDMIFASTYKIYSTVSGRRFATDLREAKQRGYLSHLPHYNSVFNYLESEALTPYLHELIKISAMPLKPIEEKFAVDSSGFSTGQFMRWLDVKYGNKEDRRMWLKLHLICGVRTNIVASVEVSDGYHKRSNVETTFHMIKSKFGQRLRSRTLTAQINEALCKVLCHNLCVVIQSVHELGIETNFEAERGTI